RAGVQGLDVADGLALFDLATGMGEATLVPMRLDLRSLSAAGDHLPPILRGLVRTTSRRTAGAGTQEAEELRQRLAGLSGAEQEQALLDLVRGQAAAVLGHAGAHAIEPDRAFNELGFDSLSAVEFRNGLSEVIGRKLPATLIFDYPNARALAGYLTE